jgi:integrase
MARRIRSKLDSRSARLALPVRRKPHSFTTIAPGLAVGYRRTRTAGSWVLRCADGKGGAWTKRIGTADDYEDADSEHILSFWQACERARVTTRGASSLPLTGALALDAYAADLRARGVALANVGRIRKHLSPTLAAKPVALLTTRELAAWRDQLLAEGMKPATVVRLCKVVKAAFNLAARRDPRIANRAAWRDGLSGIAESFASRNVQRLDDEQVRDLIAAAYAVDSAFGVYCETAAVTGARLSQIARLTVADLQADNGTPRLMMPCSRKGKNRKAEKRPVPITPALAAKLKSNRAAETPLLRRADGAAWQSTDKGDHERLYQQATERAGIKGTMYALRHSSIIRALLANVPARVTAAAHDTSIAMLERTYSAYITDHADALVRGALLDTERPSGFPDRKSHSEARANISPLAGRQQ